MKKEIDTENVDKVEELDFSINDNGKPIEIVENIFSFKGRLKRSTYWLWRIILTIAGWIGVTTIFFSGAINLQLLLTDYNSPLITVAIVIIPIVILICLLLMFWVELAINVQRCHDRNKSGWYLLINLIPIIGPIIYLVGLFMPGTIGPNRFGPDIRNYKVVCPQCGSTQRAKYHMFGDIGICSKCKAEFALRLNM